MASLAAAPVPVRMDAGLGTHLVILAAVPEHVATAAAEEVFGRAAHVALVLLLLEAIFGEYGVILRSLAQRSAARGLLHHHIASRRRSHGHGRRRGQGSAKK